MKRKPIFLIFVALGVLLIGAPYSSAYLEYADTGFGGCDNCHGAYQDNQNYVSLVDGVDWGDDLMGVHEFMVSNDCNVCHQPGQDFPVFNNSSGGGSGLDPIGCMGCHGRAEDRGTEGDCVDPANPIPPCRDGVGMRQHHYNASPTFAGQICLNCHNDTHPASFTPVDEDVKPPYYTPDPDPNYPNKPTDSCNPNGEENFAGTTIGLDNDGDLLYDDSDCGPDGIPGDCNADGIITAGDMTALVLEIFDGDGNLPADAPGGGFPGDPAGCDANEDGIISAGDMTCIVLLVFNGPGACGGGTPFASAASGGPLYGAAHTGPEEVPVDLDIVEVQLSGNGTKGKAIRKLRLKVKNANGSGEDMKPATLTGVQNGKEVYNETRTVFDLSGNGRSRFAFPPFTPTEAGAIDWTVSIADDDPDQDTATATTIVR